MRAPETVIWNVGQGSWVTHYEQETCYHFDMGGEKYPQLKIDNLCVGKKNILYLSHADKDHVSFINKFKNVDKTLCLVDWPQHEVRSKSSEAALNSLIKCDTSLSRIVNELKFDGSPMSIPNSSKSTLSNSKLITSNLMASKVKASKLSRLKFKNANDMSRIYMLKNQVLFAGDSTRRAEKLWATDKINRISVLILGHHGSKTSTSLELIHQLKNLKFAIASARFKKYGHPHIEVIERLKKIGVPVLKTEDWGAIKIELRDSF